MTNSQIVPAVLIPFILWRVYSRVRRNIARQPYRPRRLLSSVIIFSVVLLLMALGTLRFPMSLAALGGGVLLAVPLGLVALRLTTWENSGAGEFFTPNRTIGIAVTLLFIGRFVYRIIVIFGASPATTGTNPPPPALFQSPLTLFVFGITAGYYVTYSLALYLRGRHELKAAAR